MRRLNQFGISHRYEEFPDNHTSVDYRTDESLPFLACVVRASRLAHGLALRKSDWQKIPMRKARQAVLELAGREVVITNPDKPFFPQAGHTKLHLVRYYAAVAEGALRGIAGRPIVLKRYVDGAAGEPFFQKRAPEQRPEWIETVELRFPSGRTAREIVVRDAAQLLWMVNLGCIDLNPHPVRADDLEHPDELRVDLDPGPGVSWDFVRRVTLLVRDVLDEQGLRGWPKTSGSRGMHVNVRIQRRWSFEQVRRAALALAREVERRAPDLASSKWWKEDAVGSSSTTIRTPRTGLWPRPGRCGPRPTRACRCL